MSTIICNGGGNASGQLRRPFDFFTQRRKGAKGSHDLSRLESGERNLVKPKAREGRVSGRERVHFTNWHELKHAEGVMEISPVLTRSGYAGKTSPIKSLSALGREPG
jgi:hypothetical protein